MNFYNPLAWIGLISIPVIIIMYLLKQKFTELTIPSVYLWKSAIDLSKSERPWQKLVRNLLMFLQIAAALFLVVSLAGPYITARGEAQISVLALDCSLSMQAADVSPSRFEKAKEEMISVVNSMTPSSKVSIVAVGKTPYIAINESADKQVVIEKIKGLKPSYTGIDEKATQSLLSLLHRDGEASVYFFTDKKLSFKGVEKQDVLFGQSVANIAVTLVSYALEEDKTIILSKVKNFSNKTASNTLCVYTDGVLAELKDITIEPFAEKDFFFPEISSGVRNIEVKLSQTDYLTADDGFYSYISEAPVQKVLVVTKQNVFLENVLSLMPNVELFKTEPENIDLLSGYYLYVFDGVLPEKMPEDGHILVFDPIEGNSLLQTGGEVNISGLSVMENQLLRLIGDLKFDVLKAKQITTPDWGQTVLSSPETPLIVTGQQNSQKIVVMGFDLHNTDLPLRKEFPVFMYNLMQYFIPAGVSAQTSITSGDIVELNILPDAKKVTAVTPEQKVLNLAPPFPAAPFDNTNYPGIYTLAQETEGGTIYGSFAVNVDTKESNLTRDELTGETANAYKNTVDVNKNLSRIFLFLVLLLLTIEWLVFCRGR